MSGLRKLEAYIRQLDLKRTKLTLFKEETQDQATKIKCLEQIELIEAKIAQLQARVDSARTPG
jgi:hypothetical protein